MIILYVFFSLPLLVCLSVPFWRYFRVRSAAQNGVFSDFREFARYMLLGPNHVHAWPSLWRSAAKIFLTFAIQSALVAAFMFAISETARNSDYHSTIQGNSTGTLENSDWRMYMPLIALVVIVVGTGRFDRYLRAVPELVLGRLRPGEVMKFAILGSSRFRSPARFNDYLHNALRNQAVNSLVYCALAFVFVFLPRIQDGTLFPQQVAP